MLTNLFEQFKLFVELTNGAFCIGPIPDGPGRDSEAGLLRFPLPAFPSILVLYLNVGFDSSDGAELEFIEDVFEFIVIFKPANKLRIKTD